MNNSENFIYKGQFLKVSEEEIEGNIYERAYLPGADIIFAFDALGKVILIKEKRVHEIPNTRWKTVTGFFEDGLTWRENAQKELQEEIGFKAKNLKLINETSITGGFNMDKRLILATDLVESKIENPDGDVILEIKSFSLDEILSMIMSAEIALTFDSLCFFYLKEYLLREAK